VGVRALRTEATDASWACAVVDGREMSGKADLLDEFAAALDFPDWAGRNWDALADCLSDLSWLRVDGKEPAGIIVLWQRAAASRSADPDSYAGAGRVVDQAIEKRVEAGLVPLYVLYPAAADTPDAPQSDWTPLRL
jgi:hypothetical protein